MPLITVKVEEKLKNEAGDVLEELGLDIPTAVRMYLKAVVREQGLPISLTLAKNAPCACTCENADVEEDEAEEAIEEAIEDGDDLIDAELIINESAPEAEPQAAPEEEEPKTERAAKKARAEKFIGLICSVPAGTLTRWGDMEDYLTKKTGKEITRPQPFRWPKVTADGEEIPYWRVISDRGAVRGDKMIEKEVQEAKLAEEGHGFVPAGHGKFSGIKVENYKDKLMKF